MAVWRRNHIAADGKWTKLIAGDYCSADATEVDCTFAPGFVTAANQIYVSYGVCLGTLKSPDASYSFSGTVGTMGAKTNDPGTQSDGLFDADFTSNAASWRSDLNVDATNNGGATITENPLTVTGTVSFSAKGFFAREQVASFTTGNGNDLRSIDDDMDPDGGSYTMGCWLKITEPANGADTAYAMSLGHISNSVNTNYLAFTSSSLESRWQDSGCTAGTELNLAVPTTAAFGEYVYAVSSWDSGSTTAKLYLNGQLGDSGTIASICNPGGGDDIFKIGDSGPGHTSTFARDIQDCFFEKGTAWTDEQVLAAYSRRFTNTPQLAGGHTLTDDSFPVSDVSGEVAYWHLNDLLDDSGNGLTLSVTGTATNDGLGLFGEADAANFKDGTDGLFVTDAFFNYGQYWAFGGVLVIDDWTASPQRFFSLNDGSTDEVTVGLSSSNTIGVATTSGLTIGTGTFPFTGVNGKSYHMAFVFDVTEQRLDVYIDGELEHSTSLTGTTTAPGSNLTFRISGDSSGALQPMNGRMNNAFFSKRRLSPVDIKKLAGAAIFHNSNLELNDQEWFVTVKREDAHQGLMLPMSGAIDTHDPNGAYFDFSGHPAGSVINLETRRL
jgi:hypothetical protein